MSDRKGRQSAIRRVMLSTDTVGGVWNFSLELASGLSRRGIETILAAMGGHPDATQLQAARSIPGLRLFTAVCRLEWMEDPWEDVDTAAAWLMQLEREFEPDVVHMNTFTQGARRWWSPTVLTAHSCVTTWWQAVRGEELPDTWGRYRRHVNQTLRRADVVVAPTRAMLRALRSCYCVSGVQQSRVIHNGRDVNSFFSARNREPFILCAGRVWDEGKNLKVMCDVAPDLQWPVLFAGDCKGPDGQNFAVSGGQWLGRLTPKQMCERLSRAALFVSPSRYEPFGLAVLEAALSGCPLVLSDIPSFRELWSDAAVFVPADDRATLTRTLQQLIADPNRRARLGEQALERARTYSADAMVDAYLDCYREARKVHVRCAS